MSQDFYIDVPVVGDQNASEGSTADRAPLTV